jgi:hypothetical protein
MCKIRYYYAELYMYVIKITVVYDYEKEISYIPIEKSVLISTTEYEQADSYIYYTNASEQSTM